MKLKQIAKQNIGKIITVAVFVIIMWIFAILKKNSDICEYVFARGISRSLLGAISSITNKIPFSITEIFYLIAIIGLTIALASVIIHFVKHRYALAVKIMWIIAVIAMAMVVAINVLFTFSYTRHPLGEELGLEQVEVNLPNSAKIATYYIEEAKLLSTQFDRNDDGSVVSPYSFDEMVELINKEYERLDSDYFSPFTVVNKEMMFSKVMSYMGLTGIYFPYFAESNINVDIPSYTLPVTICHEMAHSKGVMRENEANFTAYYLMITSKVDYFRYCGLMFASNIMLNETYDSNDDSYYFDTYAKYSDVMLAENQSSREHWDEYDTFLDDVSNWFNNLYLRSSGVADGTKSYSQTGVFLMRLYETIHNGSLKY